MANKVHAVGVNKVGGDRLTLCNTFFAEGFYAVLATTNPFDVTCKACIKKMPAKVYTR